MNESLNVAASPAAKRGGWTTIDLAIIIAIPLLSGAMALVLGQDVSGDQLMYHFYTPHAFVAGRLNRDVAAAGLGSFHNPLMYLPFYVAVQLLPARAVGFCIGAVQGLNGSILYAIARHLLRPPSTASRFLALSAALAGLFSVTNQFELGATSFDNVVSLFVLSACLLVLRSPSWSPALVGGLVGVAAGLKLTFLIYPAALIAALALTGAGVIRSLKVAGWTVVGFTAAAGGFMWSMFARYGNPLFPYYNGVFRSPFFAPLSFTDARWAFRSWREVAASPAYFAFNSVRLFESRMFDARWLVFAVVAATAPFWWQKLSDRTRFLFLFVSLSFAVWAFKFAYLRYLVPADFLAMTVVVAVIVESWSHLLSAEVVAALLCWIIVATTRTEPGPRIAWGRKWYSAVAPRFPEPEHVVVVLEGDIAFAAAFFQPQVTFLGLFTNFFMVGGSEGRLLKDSIEVMKGRRVFHLAEQGSPGPWKSLDIAIEYRSLGLMIDRERCETVPSNVRALELCPVVPWRENVPTRVAEVQTHGPPPRALPGGFVDRMTVQSDRVVLEGWGLWKGVRHDQRLLVFTGAPVERTEFSLVARADVAKGHPLGLLGFSGFRLELKTTVPIGALCLHSLDPELGDHELAGPASIASGCEELRR
jgi:hypothetical protein